MLEFLIDGSSCKVEHIAFLSFSGGEVKPNINMDGAEWREPTNSRSCSEFQGEESFTRSGDEPIGYGVFKMSYKAIYTALKVKNTRDVLIEKKTKEILIFTPEGFLIYIVGLGGVSCLLTVIMLLVTGSLK